MIFPLIAPTNEKLNSTCNQQSVVAEILDEIWNNKRMKTLVSCACDNLIESLSHMAYKENTI